MISRISNKYLWERCWLVVFFQYFIECNMQMWQPFKSRIITTIVNCRQYKNNHKNTKKKWQFFYFLLVKLLMCCCRPSSRLFEIIKTKRKKAIELISICFTVNLNRELWKCEIGRNDHEKNSDEINRRQWPWSCKKKIVLTILMISNALNIELSQW